VPLGADAQAVTRRLLYRVVEITEMWQQIKADDP
jgi:hypothetical protein